MYIHSYLCIILFFQMSFCKFNNNLFEPIIYYFITLTVAFKILCLVCWSLPSNWVWKISLRF